MHNKSSSLVFVFILFMISGVSCTNQMNQPLVPEHVSPAPPKPLIQKSPIPNEVTLEFLEGPTEHPSHTLTPIPLTISPTPVIHTNKLCTPLEDHPIDVLPEIVSDPYNPPPAGKEGRHMGVDFSYYQFDDRVGIEGVRVQSMLPGDVVAVLANEIPYGYAVIIETPVEKLPDEWMENTVEYELTDSIYFLYAHLKELPTVKIGDSVQCGEQIGIVGDTGGVNTPYAIPHLHLEMRVGPAGARFDEMGYYDTRISEIARQNYLKWRTSGEFRHFDPMILIKSYLVNAK